MKISMDPSLVVPRKMMKLFHIVKLDGHDLFSIFSLKGFSEVAALLHVVAKSRRRHDSRYREMQ